MTDRIKQLVRLAIGPVVLLLAAAPAATQAQFSSGAFGTPAGQTKGPVTAHARFTAPSADRPGYLLVTATIQPGWHIYSITQAEGGPIASKIEIAALSPGVRIADKFRPSVAPDAKKEELFDNMVVETHHGTVTWYAPLELAAGVDPARLRIAGKLTVQSCDANSCLPPQHIPFVAVLGPGVSASGLSAPRPAGSVPFAAKAVVAPAVAAAAATKFASAGGLGAQGLFWQLGAAFLGGLILNLMPCVLPVISLKILAFLQQAGESRARVFALNVWYSAGLLSVFMMLAALAASAGLAWGEQFTLPWFKVAMTAFVFAMALSFLGVWEIPIPGFVGVGRANQLQAQEGPAGAFFKGVFTTILATPCSGPLLGPVFGYLLKQPPYMAYWVFGAVGLGMASPYLLIGAFPQLIRFLPRPGGWMETVKQVMAFLLLATVVYLFNTMSSRYFIPTLSLLVGLWFACWWIGRTPLTAGPGRQFAAWLGGPAVAVLVGWFAFTVMLEEPKIAWQAFSPEAVARAQAEGKTVMVDFSANWCPNCKSNLKFAIETESVRRLIAANGVVPMLADWTDPSPVIKKALNDLGYNSIPLLAIWPGQAKKDAAGQKPIVLSDLLPESQVLAALKEAGPSERRR